jgi:hypothetical protein
MLCSGLELGAVDAAHSSVSADLVWVSGLQQCCVSLWLAMQVGMRVLTSGFDEGADVREFEHWNS